LFSRAEFGAFKVLNLSDQCCIRWGNFYFKPYKPEEKGGEKIRGSNVRRSDDNDERGRTDS
jgi:hypothetical protein